MAKFTPGPWKKTGHNIVDDKHKNIIASVENDTNAQLIAAAPEMYKLLKSLAFYIKATTKLQRQYMADEFCDYATSIEELLSRIDGEEQE